MDSGREIKKQIVIRTMQQPKLATGVVGNNIGILFGPGDLEYKTITQSVSHYYRKYKSKPSPQALNAVLANRIEILVRTKLLTDKKKVAQYITDADQWLNGKIDTSDGMTSMVSDYIHNKLVSFVLKSGADKYDHDPIHFNLNKYLNHKIDAINQIDVTGQGNHVIDVYKDYSRESQAFKELNKDKIPMGMINMDRALSHGLAKGEVGLIGASSGGGKTTILSNFSVAYTKMGYNVFHISLEELASQMLLRFIRELLGFTPKQIFDDKGHVDPATEMQVYRHLIYLRAKTHIGTLAFYRTSPRTLTIDGLRQLITSYENIHHIKFDVVTLDYPDLLLNTYHTGNEAEDGGRMFQDLRKMAQDLNVVLWTATQLNRMATGQKVKTMSSAEGSYRKINTVEFAATVNETHKEFQHGFMRLHIDKLRNRYDFSGLTLYFKYDPPTMRISPENKMQLAAHRGLLGEDVSEDKIDKRAFYRKTDGIKNKQQINHALNKLNHQAKGKW